jgi:release factor glutamine methyltransferase
VSSSSTPSTYEQLLGEVKASWKPLPDKPEETAEGLLNALWLTAAGVPTSVESAKGKPLPELNSESYARLRHLLDKRISGVPLAHLTERQRFFGVELIAGPGALIPRKETEIVGRAALSKLKSLVAERGQALVLDVCTGSGNLALAYAFSEPRCRVFGADLSQEAVDLAGRNLHFTGLGDRVEFRQGNLLDPFESPEFLGKVDLLSCNPPYISSRKVPTMVREISEFEPELAFDGGPFGVSILTKLIRNAPRFLKPDSWLCFEVGLGQGPALARQLQNSEAFSQVETHPDQAGEIRAMSARTKS